ncbi:MAG: quaternary amine ABC transporter ATP-binding protein [Steroidobacteraceae bacterium]
MGSNVSESDTVIELKGVWKVFGANAEAALAAARAGMPKAEVLSRHNAVVGIADASFSVRRGEIFCIMGLSGSGKSTLLRHVNRLVEPSAGEVRVLGTDVRALNDADLRRLRAERVGMVFQNMALLPHRSVRDNVAYPLEIRREPKARRWAVSEQKLALVGLSGYEDRYPSELSGGMQQRVGLARALASDPEVLLMDEPFSALDPLIRRELQNQFIELSRSLNKTTLFITHDLDEAIRVGSRIAVMKDGRIMQVGAAAEIVTQPAGDYIREFVQHISKLQFVVARSIMEPLDTLAPSPARDLSRAPTSTPDANLDQLVALSANQEQPIVVVDSRNIPIGVVTNRRLLTAIKDNQ